MAHTYTYTHMWVGYVCIWYLHIYVCILYNVRSRYLSVCWMAFVVVHVTPEPMQWPPLGG